MVNRSAAEKDFDAASREFDNNVDVRRLMFVIANILVPASAVAVTDCLGGDSYPESLRWLPENILWIVGLVLAIGCVLISANLARCHFGLVINSAKMARAREGDLKLGPLNWLGVTTNFVALTGLSATAGASLALLASGAPWWAHALSPLLFVALMLWLSVQHRRANARCRSAVDAWQHGPIAEDLVEDHVRRSLDSTTADISVIVTMAGALFAGAFNVMTNLGGIPDSVELGLPREDLQVHGVTAVAAFALVSLLLSCRMVVRLRIALAQHSQKLAKLRGEVDDAWSFRPFERSYVLYLLLVVFVVACAVIAGWNAYGQTMGMMVGGALFLASVAWYPIQLRVARPG